MVENMLSIVSTDIMAHEQKKEWELAKEVHRLAHLGVCFHDKDYRGVVFPNGLESSVVLEVKKKQHRNPIF